ncbi:MAG: ferritin-like domain-containing protein [Actinomycetota bacterium]|nr:ferritin-like domain-containing protein [Actinomycetota bacterium]
MQKQTINVPGAEGFAQPRTRRDFFKALAVAGATGVAGASLFTSKKASAQIGGTQEGDAGILNFALTLEFLERDFYAMAVDRGVLSGPALGVVIMLRDTEQAHVDFLTTALQGAGATPAPKPEFTFPPESLASQAGVLQLASVLEPTGVGAYLGAGPMIQNPDFLEAAGTIAGVEGDHVVAIRNLLGFVPPTTTPFPEALTKDQVLAAIAPFLGMGKMPATGGPGE